MDAVKEFEIYEVFKISKYLIKYLLMNDQLNFPSNTLYNTDIYIQDR